jgi:hypothetical protein
MSTKVTVTKWSLNFTIYRGFSSGLASVALGDPNAQLAEDTKSSSSIPNHT